MSSGECCSANIQFKLPCDSEEKAQAIVDALTEDGFGMNGYANFVHEIDGDVVVLASLSCLAYTNRHAHKEKMQSSDLCLRQQLEKRLPEYKFTVDGCIFPHESEVPQG